MHDHSPLILANLSLERFFEPGGRLRVPPCFEARVVLARLSQLGPKTAHRSRRNDLIEVKHILDVGPLAEYEDMGPFVTRYINLSEEATGHV